VLSINDKKVNEIGGKLIESRANVDEKTLADVSVGLAELLPTAAS
jgi:hypothetical protein